MFFIVSTGRCGSTSLVDILNTHPDIKCYQQASIIHTLTHFFIQRDISFMDMITRFPMGIQIPFGQNNKEWLERGSLLEIGDHVGHFSTENWALIPILEIIYNMCNLYNMPILSYDLEIKAGQKEEEISKKIEFKDINITPKYIWIMRDLRDVVSSWIGRQLYIKENILWFNGNNDVFTISPIPKEGLVPVDLDVKGWKFGECTKEEWDRMTQFEKVCWFVGFVMRKIDFFLGNVHRSRKYVVKMEDLMMRPNIINNIFFFLGFHLLDKPEFPHSNKATYSLVPWKQWTKEQNKQFDKHVGEIMYKWYGGFNGSWS